MSSLLLLTSQFSFSLSAADNIIVDQRFTIENLVTQDPPKSLAWFASHDGIASNRGANMRIRAGNARGARSAAAHFPRASLAIGDTLTYEIDFHIGSDTADNNNALRVGIFDSEDKEQNIFTQNGKDPLVTSSGYAFFLNPLNARGSSTLGIFKRQGRSTLINDERHYSKRLTPNLILPDPLISARHYNLEIALTRINKKMLKIVVELSGGGIPRSITYSVEDKSPTLSFDTLALGIQQPGAADVYFNRITITHETSVQ